MCGICGTITAHPEADEAAVGRMNDALVHRGPDGEGHFTAPHLAMAMRRLSIIDLESGWQPLYNEDHSLALIANAEIYNYIELREMLIKRGHRFQTASDCETVLHLYEEYGLDCVKYLRGMFAIALWDGSKKRLLLARDRLGEKPLYLYQREGELLFASELKSLLASGKIPFELDPAAIHLYFHYQYVPEPQTPVKGIRKLPGGHVLIVETEPWQVSEQAYWQIQDIPAMEGNPSTLIREQLEELSALVIRSDVPVGVALSGGLDSSIVAILAARKYPGQMHAFSVGYPGRPDHDERAQARELAEQLGMPFHEIELSPGEQVEAFAELVYWQDDPIADISGFGYYAVSRSARQAGVPVLLQGQGGDELFWGYPWVRAAARQTRRKQSLTHRGWRTAPQYFHSDLPEDWTLRSVKRWVFSSFRLPGLKEYLRDLKSPPDQMVFMDLAPGFPLALREMQHYYSAHFREQVEDICPASIYQSPLPWPPIDVEITRLIMQTYLLENGIAQGDRLSMSNSVELRLPLLDYRLVETVIGLRRTQPDDRLRPKQWLKDSMQDLLPVSLSTRPKRGFQPPVSTWQQNVFARYGQKLKDGYLVGTDILDPRSTSALVEGANSDSPAASILFKALVFELWCRKFAI